jgi:AcrR family transcriptional regulator
MSSTVTAKADGRLERGHVKRQAILRQAVDLASLEGLEGVSIGRLANRLGISKSGVVLHFGSKEELQLATVAAAAQRFVTRVCDPAMRQPVGLARLWWLCWGWIDYVDHRLFPGGCFFSTVGAEFHSRPGRVRDAIAAAHLRWMELLHRQVEAAQGAAELSSDIEPAQLAYELDALVRQANLGRQLHHDQHACARSRRAVRDRLTSVALVDLPAEPSL